MNNNQPFVRFATWCLSIALIISYNHSYSQTHHSLSKQDSIYSAELSKTYTADNKIFLEHLKAETDDKKLLKYFETRYNKIFKAMNEEILDGDIINLPEVSSFLDSVLTELKAKNPGIPKDIKILVLREQMPNAYTVGDNYIQVTLGLFYYLENDDQVAAVLSHEIGHIMLKHLIKAMTENYATDKNNIDVVKTIRQAEAKKSDKAFDLLKGLVYTERKNDRMFEMQADSFGYTLLIPTRYQKKAFPRLLQILDSCDNIKLDGVTTESYKRFFDLPNQKFNEQWLNSEDFSSYNYSSYTPKYNKDSILSHPKGKERIEHLQQLFPQLSTLENNIPGNTTSLFKKSVSTANAIYFPNLYFNEQYGVLIYVSLLHLQTNATDTFYREWLGKGFQKIYEARRDYTLNKYLDRVSPNDQTKSYMQFLGFMWNLKLEELKIFADYYAPKQPAGVSN